VAPAYEAHGKRQYLPRRQQEHLQAFLRLTHRARKLSIPEFAESVALSDSTMRRLLNYSDRAADPMTLFLAKRLAQGLGVSLDTLLGPPEPRPAPAPVPAVVPTPTSEAPQVLAALQDITALLRDLLVVKELLSDLLQVQYDALRLLNNSHYEKDSA
jgi:hypothetical protein